MSRNYPGGIRLTQRDYEALGCLTNLRVVRLDDLACLLAHIAGNPLPLGIRTTRDVVNRWVDCGYANTHRNPRGGLCLVTVTLVGARLTSPFPTSTQEQPGVSQQPVGLPAWRDIPHDVTVAAVAVWLVSTKRCQWRGVASVREQLPAGAHLSDGAVVTQSGHRMALEVERHAKSRMRWRENLASLLDQWDQTLYFAPLSVQRSLTVWLNTNLPPQEVARVHVFALGELAR